MSNDRYGEPVGLPEINSMTLALKALVVRSGGRVEITSAELEAAQLIACHVDADPERLVIAVVDGAPPDRPRRDTGVRP